MSDFYKKILDNNKLWVETQLALDSNFFNDLSKGQTPPLLWIGCSDSRVPANEIIGAKPGEVFVHRNIANMVVHSDMNMLSVLDYAVNALKVKHVIVCGHYGCGGVKAAMTPQDFGLMNPWLRTIRDVYRLHQEELDSIKDEQLRYDRLIELNVQEQCINVIKMACVQERYILDHYPIVHGWVFDLKTGKLIDLNIDFEEILKNIQKVYDLTNSDWVMSRKNNKNF